MQALPPKSGLMAWSSFPFCSLNSSHRTKIKSQKLKIIPIIYCWKLRKIFWNILTNLHSYYIYFLFFKISNFVDLFARYFKVHLSQVAFFISREHSVMGRAGRHSGRINFSTFFFSPKC